MSQSDEENLDDLVNAITPAPAKALTEDELQFVTFMHQHYSLTGSIIGQEVAKDLIGIPSDEYQNLMTDNRVLSALEERGVVLKESPVGEALPIKEWKRQAELQSLTPVQLVVANTMLDLIDTRSQKKKLQDLNVSTTTYNTWLKDPVFRDYLKTRAESMLGENQHEAHLALLDKVRMGDLKAIELYYEFQGIYTRASATQVNANQVAVDIQNLLVRIIEIINDEVWDLEGGPQVAANIADKFKGLMQARTIAGEVVQQPVTVPEIAQARTITPELQAIMDKGDGFQ